MQGGRVRARALQSGREVAAIEGVSNILKKTFRCNCLLSLSIQELRHIKIAGGKFKTNYMSCFSLNRIKVWNILSEWTAKTKTLQGFNWAIGQSYGKKKKSIKEYSTQISVLGSGCSRASGQRRHTEPWALCACCALIPTPNTARMQDPSP